MQTSGRLFRLGCRSSSTQAAAWSALAAESHLPGFSGRSDDTVDQLWRRQRRDASTSAPTVAAPAQPANTSKAPASPTSPTAPPSSPTPSLSAPAPFYAGLAARYPDPASIPEPLLARMRAELFGRPVARRELTGRRALARPLRGRQVADWYWLPRGDVPGFHNEEKEYEASKLLNKRHLKAPPGAEGGEGAAPAAKGKKKK